jgi:hypothetical protein
MKSTFKKIGEIHMAHNFEILTYRTSDMLHLKLFGVFDEGSAAKLLNELKKNSYGIDGICIHANNLKKIYSYGRKMIRENLSWINTIEPYVLITGGNLGQAGS